MLTYLFRRLLAMVPTLIGITFVTFLIVNLAPGDPVATSFGASGGERGAEAGGGGADQDRLADAIKAKKKLLGMVTEDRSLHQWDVDGVAVGEGLSELHRTKQLGDLDGWAHAIAMSPDGSKIYVAGDGADILVLSTDSGDVLSRLVGHPVSVWSMALSADGSRLVTGDINGVVRLWDTNSLTELAASDPVQKPTRDLLMLEDGQVLSAGGDGKIRLHDAETLRTVQTYKGHRSGVYAMVLAPSGKTFLSGGYDRVLREWDLDTAQILQSSEVHGQAINDIALSPDGGWLATACDDRKIRLLNRNDWTAPPTILEGHYKAATAISFSSDGNRLISGSRDETVRVWQLGDNPREIARPAENVGRIHTVLPTATGVLTAGDSWKTVPVWKRYLRWAGRIAVLDFDRSFVDDRPVMDKIKKALPITLYLNVIAITIMYLVSIPIGVMGAVKRGSTFDNVSSVILFLLYSIPNFWLATLLIMFLSSKQHFDILPSIGLHSDNTENMTSVGYLWDWFLHMVLPIIVMVYAGFASLSRYARTTMLETIREDYVRTARAKGLAERVVIYKHAFRNSLITIVTLLGNLLPAMIGGSVIVEFIFSINGMGKLGFDAILARDYPTIMAITTFSAFLTLLGILVSDLLYSVVDPRVGET